MNKIILLADHEIIDTPRDCLKDWCKHNRIFVLVSVKLKIIAIIMKLPQKDGLKDTVVIMNRALSFVVRMINLFAWRSTI